MDCNILDAAHGLCYQTDILPPLSISATEARTSTPTRMLKRSRSVLEKRNGSRSWASMQDFVQDCFEFGATLK